VLINNAQQFFLRVEGLTTFGKNKQWTLQIYYPYGQLRWSQLPKYGKDFHVNVEAITLRINHDANGCAFGIKLFGFGFGVRRMSDAAHAENQRLHEKFDEAARGLPTS